MELYHNARKLEYRTPYGAVPVGTAITLRIDAPEAEPGQVYLRLWTGEETLIPMERGTDHRYSAEITAPETPGLVWYYFRVDAPGGTVFYGKHTGGAGWCTMQPESWQITVYQPQSLPEWYRNAGVYPIFPDRFARGADWLRCRREPGAW